MRDKDNPCVPDCPDRSATCHAGCERYEKYWQKKRKENEENNKKYQSHYRVGDMMVFKKSGGRCRMAMPPKTRR